MYKLKRVYDASEASDGYHVLMDRIWPRGVSKEKARIDLWMNQIAPSDALRRWFGHDFERWEEFQKLYSEELQKEIGLTDQLKQLESQHGTLTLVFSARDDHHNQAVALRAFLLGRE